MIVDVIPKFLTPVTHRVIPHIASLIAKGRYGVYVLAEYSDRGPAGRAVPPTRWQRTYGDLHHSEFTVTQIADALRNRPVVRVVKSTRSLFGTDERLTRLLRRRGIREIHIVGIETHDCVMATALDAFDRDFITCVLSKGCASKSPRLHRAACTILRKVLLLR
ncbi:MAG: cysteine hydrolase [Gemmatimonadaceae bacterium]|nr:cysteine hydrolase [Gemmatimonadaceae bacterium]